MALPVVGTPKDTKRAVAELLAPMLKKTLFVAINHVAAQASEIEPFIADHWPT